MRKFRALNESACEIIAAVTDTPDRSRTALEVLEAITTAAQQRQALAAALARELDTSTTSLTESEIATVRDTARASKYVPRSTRGVAGRKLVDSARQWLLEQEGRGLFTAIPIVPGNEYPTLMSRLPLFPAISRRKQKKMLDDDNGFPFTTPFGRGRRFGALATVDDEDVLLAVLKLRTYRLRGLGEHLPIGIADVIGRDAEGYCGVHTAIFTLTQLLEELGRTPTGSNYKNVLRSLRRLSSLVIELETAKKERYFGKDARTLRPVKQGGGIRLVEIAWSIHDESRVVLAQFSPIVVMWLEREFTYVNWEIRKQLPSWDERAIHRFLSSQPAVYSEYLEKIASAAGILAPSNKIKSIFTRTLNRLKTLGWLRDYRIEGTGRATPHRLFLDRTKRKS